MRAVRVYVYVLLWKGQMAFEFYWISFLYKFPSIFFSFHFVLLFLSSFMDSAAFPFSPSLGCSPFPSCISNLVRSTFRPLVLEVLVQYARLYRIIYESPIQYKLFTSYTTKYRHRYTDTTWIRRWWLFVHSIRTIWARSDLFPLPRTDTVHWQGKAWLGLVCFSYRSAEKHINCIHFNIPMYGSKLNLYTKLHIYWILPNTFVYM